jgi:2-polyprenyl-6-methoxyphenol hydroxylase-like FAD-dependent oxidoreductase
MQVLIIGGGIAGPAAAIALAKAGISSEIYEAYPADAAVSASAGAFLTITANGQDALRAVGADRPVLDASFPATRLRLFDAHGAKLADLPLGGDFPSSRTLTRAALSQALRAEAAGRGIPVHHGKQLTSATADRDGQVTAIFSDGTHATGDLLIGADGIHSPVRVLIDPGAPAPRYTGLVIACGYAPAHPDAAGPEGYSMYYGNRAFLGCTNGPDGRTWWFARIPADEPTAARLATAGDASDIAAPFDGDNTPAAALIRSSASPLTVTAAYDIPHLPTWSTSAMIVIGDAAHAVSPSTTQGASLAIEDAAVLAQCLRDLPAIPGALTAFEELRRHRVEHVVQMGADATNPAPPAPGPRRRTPDRSVLAHHIEWEARLALRSRIRGFRGGQELTGRGFVCGGDQHPDTLQLQLRVLTAGIIRRHDRSQPVVAQQADDQFRLRTAGDDSHRNHHLVQDLNSSRDRGRGLQLGLDAGVPGLDRVQALTPAAAAGNDRDVVGVAELD